MNKNVTELYEKALAIVIDEYGLTVEKLFGSNDGDCVQARMALLIALTKEGLTDKEIAECIHMRRCTVCKIRNKYDDRTAPWTVKICIEHIKKMCAIS
jgi:hypothetical protein